MENDIRLLARARDPLTSITAAEQAQNFSGSHRTKIQRALSLIGSGTAHDIATKTGLSVVQVDRRLPELQREDVAHVLQLNGEDFVRNGYRVWTLKKNLAEEQQNVA